MINRQKLIEKGWTEEEIQLAEGILSVASEKKSEKVKTLDKLIYWAALFLVLVGNFVLSVILIPFLLFATPVYLYPGVMFFGIILGALFDLIIIDLEKIEGAVFKSGMFLFAVAIINIFIITALSNQLAALLAFERGVHITILVSLAYVVGFMFPHIYSRKSKFMERIAG